MIAMQLFGAAHLVVLALTVCVPIALVKIARASKNDRLARDIARALAVVLILNKVAGLCVAHSLGRLEWGDELPMQLCDWAMIAAILALIWNWQLAYEMAY